MNDSNTSWTLESKLILGLILLLLFYKSLNTENTQ